MLPPPAADLLGSGQGGLFALFITLGWNPSLGLLSQDTLSSSVVPALF